MLIALLALALTAGTLIATLLAAALLILLALGTLITLLLLLIALLALLMLIAHHVSPVEHRKATCHPCLTVSNPRS
ncbi:MAG TPA: hypothetical protein VL381_05605 [Rhodocyclaceae bacterium]|nr:hypothetical protein [Rhodocyclaceae bacterium]